MSTATVDPSGFRRVLLAFTERLDGDFPFGACDRLADFARRAVGPGPSDGTARMAEAATTFGPSGPFSRDMITAGPSIPAQIGRHQPMVNPIQYERAASAWPLLTGKAASASKITYADLSQHLGIHARPIRYVLGVIQDYCLREKLPPLTILVVNRRGFPSEGFIAWDVDDLDEGYRLVYGYPWHELANPFGFAASGTTLEQLAQRLLTKPEESAEVYGRIQNRGMAQVLFRQTLLAAYGWLCAFCGLSLGAALQAAHIIPWRKATVAQRLDPRNGLLLCATHHALFDADILTVTLDRRIAFRPGRRANRRRTEADQHAAVSLAGQNVRTPADPDLQPSVEALQHRASGLTDPA